jgi:hypothetical protein
MKHQIKDNRIYVDGTTQEIKDLVREVAEQMQRNGAEQLEDMLLGLEKVIDHKQYTFGIHHRIYFNKESFLYVPNCSGKDNQKFHYGFFKPLFDIAYSRVTGQDK